MLALATMALLAAVAVMACAAPLWLRLTLVLLVFGYTAKLLSDLRAPRVAMVSWRSDQTWGLRLANGEEIDARLRTGRVLGGLIVLRLAWEPHGSAALVLLSDNLDADSRRRLRMRLSSLADSD